MAGTNKLWTNSIEQSCSQLKSASIQRACQHNRNGSDRSWPESTVYDNRFEVLVSITQHDGQIHRLGSELTIRFWRLLSRSVSGCTKVTLGGCYFSEQKREQS